jgi:DNA-binding transcriptional LysR family regulator
LDWNDLRDFLAISRHRTLSAAADALGVQQSTMGRRLKALEARVGTKLLQKTPAGFVLTSAGEAILDNVERIESETQAVERAISGRDRRLDGVVRLSAVEGLTVEVLTPILADFHAHYPGITLDLITNGRHASLTKGEADLALRLSRFTQNDLVVRKVAQFAFAAYASPAYIAARGVPDFAQSASDHRVLLAEEGPSDSPQAAWFAAMTNCARLALRANSFFMLVAAAKAGMGIVCLPRFLGDAAPLTRLWTPVPSPVGDLWLGMHQDIRSAPRFRALTEFLIEGLRHQAARLNPPLIPDQSPSSCVGA